MFLAIAGIIAAIGGIAWGVWNGIEKTKSNNETKRHNQEEEALAEAQLEQNAELQREQEIADYETQLALQQQQQEFDLYQSSTEYQRKLADLQAAGLNPALALGGSSAGAGTGLTAGSIPNQNAKSGTSNDESNITSALALEATIRTAAEHPKEFFNNIYKSARQEARTTALTVKEEYNDQNEA